MIIGFGSLDLLFLRLRETFVAINRAAVKGQGTAWPGRTITTGEAYL